jgi:hypothetical protein
VVFSAGLALVVAAVFLRWPKGTLKAAIPALLLQDLAVAVLGGRVSSLGRAAQNADEIALAVFLLCTAAVVWTQGLRFRVRPWVGWYLVYVLATIASTKGFVSSHSALLGLFLVSKGFVFAFVCEQVGWTGNDSRQLVRLVLGVIAVVIVFAIPDLLAPAAFRSLLGFDPTVETRGSVPSVVSLLGHPGGYGWLTGIGALIALANLLAGGSRRWAIVLVICLVASSLSFRRKPFLAVLAAMVLVATTLPTPTRNRRILLGLASVGLIAIPIVSAMWPIVVEGARAYVTLDAVTSQARTVLYAGALLLAQMHFPLGAGIGSYGSYGSVTNYSPLYYEFGMNSVFGMSPDYPNFIQDAFWPQIIGETGLLGVIGYAGALLALLIPAWKALRRAQAIIPQSVAIVAVLVGLETIFESFAAPTFSVASHACLSMGLLGVAGMASADSRSEVSNEHHLRNTDAVL